MATMLEDYRYMDVRGANEWHGFELLEFSPISFFLPQESKFGAGDASILEKALILAAKIKAFSKKWEDVPLEDKVDIVAALRLFPEMLKQVWRFTKYAILTTRVIAIIIGAI